MGDFMGEVMDGTSRFVAVPATATCSAAFYVSIAAEFGKRTQKSRAVSVALITNPDLKWMADKWVGARGWSRPGQKSARYHAQTERIVSLLFVPHAGDRARQGRRPA